MLVVRTQEKLATLQCKDYGIGKENYKNVIYTILNNGEIITLGKYRTKKRCLEVLDEMDKAQEMQMSKCNTRVVDENGHTIKNEYTNHYFKIYYMPKK